MTILLVHIYYGIEWSNAMGLHWWCVKADLWICHLITLTLPRFLVLSNLCKLRNNTINCVRLNAGRGEGQFTIPLRLPYITPRMLLNWSNSWYNRHLVQLMLSFLPSSRSQFGHKKLKLNAMHIWPTTNHCLLKCPTFSKFRIQYSTPYNKYFEATKLASVWRDFFKHSF